MLPSFESDVVPVLKRLKLSKDQADLAEWLASRYEDHDEQKLHCLDYALESAMRASSEIEQRMRFGVDDAKLKAAESQALEAVKRISQDKSALSDKTEVNSILQSSMTSSSGRFGTVQRMIDGLTVRLQANFWGSSDSSPEKFVEALLIEASILASSECFAEGSSFSVGHFRHMSRTVHKACKEISQQYSHVHVGQIARFLARRWLVHGDCQTQSTKVEEVTTTRGEPISKNPDSSTLSLSEMQDDTLNFVMDLSDLGQSADVASSSQIKSPKSEHVVKEEEPSALAINGSLREASEFSTARVSLRIAFVMSFADGYHSKDTEEAIGDHRLSSKDPGDAKPKTKASRSGLLSKISVQGSGAVVKHARELLRIVFAKDSDSTENVSVSFLDDSDAGDTKQQRNTLTFAMRYRALRTASILCPQEVLERVVTEEGFTTRANAGEADCSLKQCSYGSFLAKEIEELGLPLPHSDLVQLSTMHFPSYARALWRHHREGATGRLLLLLLEMSLKEDTSPDLNLAVAILQEMSKTMLPRTLLLSCEHIVQMKKSAAAPVAIRGLLVDNFSIISTVVETVAKITLGEIHNKLSLAEDSLPEHAGSVLRRLGNVVEAFADTPSGTAQITTFIEVLFGMLDSCGSEEASKVITDVLLSAACCIGDTEVRLKTFSRIPLSLTAPSVPGSVSQSKDENATISAMLRTAELSFYPWKPLVSL